MPVGGADDTTGEEKYKNNPDARTEDLIELRQWITTQKHMPEVKDDMLILFHHSCYYIMDRTKDCITAYFTLRNSAPQLFTNRDISSPELVRALEAWNSTVLPKPDPRGYRIIYGTIKDPDPSKFYHSDCLKIMLMTIDSCLAQYGAMPGIVIVLNMENVKLGHMMRMSLPSLRKFSVYNQDANPVRMREFHIVNVVSWIDKVMALMKPFLKKEILSLTHFHTNTEALYEFIPKEYLPEELGGTLPTGHVLNAENVKGLEGMREFFAEEEKTRLAESKKEKKNKKEAEPELQTRLKDLEID